MASMESLYVWFATFLSNICCEYFVKLTLCVCDRLVVNVVDAYKQNDCLTQYMTAGLGHFSN